MSGAVALFSYVGTEDEALRSAAWAGERVAEALVGDGGQIVRVQPLTRDGLAAAISGASGLAAFCHGREDALIGGHADARSAVLDRDNAHLLAGRWGYALACRAGVELAGIAVGATGPPPPGEGGVGMRVQHVGLCEH